MKQNLLHGAEAVLDPSTGTTLSDAVARAEDVAALMGRKYHAFWLKMYRDLRRRHGLNIALGLANEALVRKIGERM